MNVRMAATVTIPSVTKISSLVCEKRRPNEMSAMAKPKMKSSQVVLKTPLYRSRKTKGDSMSQMPSTRFVHTSRLNPVTSFCFFLTLFKTLCHLIFYIHKCASHVPFKTRGSRDFLIHQRFVQIQICLTDYTFLSQSTLISILLIAVAQRFSHWEME